MNHRHLYWVGMSAITLGALIAVVALLPDVSDDPRAEFRIFPTNLALCGTTGMCFVVGMSTLWNSRFFESQAKRISILQKQIAALERRITELERPTPDQPDTRVTRFPAG